MITVPPMFIYHFSFHYLELFLEMSGCINVQTMNCLIKLSEFDWLCLYQGTVNEVSSLFTKCIEFANEYI